MSQYRGATSLPAKMLKRLSAIAQQFPNPKQFYQEAIALGREYDVGETELLAWGIIDAYHNARPESFVSAGEEHAAAVLSLMLEENADPASTFEGSLNFTRVEAVKKAITILLRQARAKPTTTPGLTADEIVKGKP